MFTNTIYNPNFFFFEIIVRLWQSLQNRSSHLGKLHVIIWSAEYNSLSAENEVLESFVMVS